MIDNYLYIESGFYSNNNVKNYMQILEEKEDKNRFWNKSKYWLAQNLHTVQWFRKVNCVGLCMCVCVFIYDCLFSAKQIILLIISILNPDLPMSVSMVNHAFLQNFSFRPSLPNAVNRHIQAGTQAGIFCCIY